MASASAYMLSPPSPCIVSNSERKAQPRISIKCCTSRDSSSHLASGDVWRVGGEPGGFSSLIKQEIQKVDSGYGHVTLKVEEQMREKEYAEDKLEPLWDDGYGDATVKDFFEYASDMIKHDGGPPRWFTATACGPHLKDSPVLLFLPGVDGIGLGLILHHKALGKVFDVWCLHIPLEDRTPFAGLVSFVEETVRAQHTSCPNKPIYIVGDSFGGCLALAVAARNPDVDLVLILSNPATSFGRSDLQPLLPLLVSLPNELHVTVPYLLSFVMGEPMKMAAVGVKSAVPSLRYFEQIAKNLTSLLPHLSSLADIIPKKNFAWKLKLLRTASAFANSRLHAIQAQVLVLASGRDNMLPSRDEAWRLMRSLKNCDIRYFKDNGHAILLEDGVNLLTILKGTYSYRRTRKHDLVNDFIPPSMSEFKQITLTNRLYQHYAAPVMLSTTEDGKLVRGLAGVPSEGPVLLVGYHMLLGLELVPLIEEFLRERKIMVRGMAHPSLFNSLVNGNKEFTFTDITRLYGGLPVTPANLFKLLETRSHVLLYPGGAREALHRKGEEYKLFWPEQPEFIRMAARFGAKIVPFGAVGEDDLAELVLDYDDLMKIPILSDQLRRWNDENAINIRAGMSGEVANQPPHVPLLLPKMPGRVYYYFGKAIDMSESRDVLKDKEKARELYLYVKSQVEANINFLLRKRSEDPYRNIIDRAAFHAFDEPVNRLPAFEL